MKHPRLSPFIPPLLFCLALCLSGCQTINIPAARSGLPAGKVLLSFDDGPNCTDDSTTRLLAVLAKYKVKAQFCMLGVNVEKRPDLVRAIAAAGHTIINHGYSSDFACNMDDERFVQNLNDGEAALQKALGYKPEPMLYRPQGGFYHARQEKLWEAQGFTLAPTTIRLYDAVDTGKSADRIFKSVMRQVKRNDGGIVLLHNSRDSWMEGEAALARHPQGDYNRSWVPALVERLIIALRAAGYTV
jgi:peptidoglycan/xylan/chitin deacetylase (PgdA/CDA1 family)